ncbi:MAG TPA: 30S ribosome-binding factor RbfA [Clostridiales bacterium]|jgi:ribosome-binding factor A|nr:30S ribosome-binding factor RbfA [Clostridiales bacterium]
MARRFRPERIGEEIRRLISEVLRKEIQDPRLDGIVSISTVEVSPDHSYATAYISLLGDTKLDEASEEQKKEVLEAFQAAKGLIRRRMGKELRLHRTPDISFRIDTSMEYGRHIDRVLSELGLCKESEEDATEDDK